MDAPWLEEARTSYDTVAESYAEYVRDALGRAPLVRAGVEAFAESVRGGTGEGGAVADVGCGPGHVTAYLRSLGVAAFGIDLSPVMISVARREHPGLGFAVGSMTQLGIGDASLAGLLAFWSLIHIPDEAMPRVLGEFRRVLRPDGLLLAGFHLGEVSRRKTQGYGGHPMNVYVHRRTADRMARWFGEAGFVLTSQMLMDLETSSPGAMFFARPAGAQTRAN